MGIDDTIIERNKTSEQLICSYENNIVKRDFTNILNLFHTFVWLKKSNEAFDAKSWDLLNWFYSIPRREWINIYDLYFHGQSRSLGCGYAKNHDCGHGYIGKFKNTHFITRSGIIIWKKGKRKMWWKSHLTNQFHEVELGLKSIFLT